jgi:poly(3-hydroxybutyrate) depolymerase
MSALSAMKHGPAARTDAAAAGHSDNAVVTAEPVPAIVFHGDSDAVVHPDNGVRAIEAALDRAELSIMDCAAPPPRVEQGQSAQGRGYTRTLHTDIDSPRVQAEHWVIHGLGHAWSGGSANGSHTDPSGPDASREMWRFFSTHAQPERRSQRG